MISIIAKGFVVPIIGIISFLESSPSTLISLHDPVPIIEVIKVYGKLAGPQCFGHNAPPGASCQLPLSQLKEELFGDSSGNGETSSLSKEEFSHRLESLSFQWPLKPFGIAGSPSLTKTATMNKGAETALYMSELERLGLYDRRNPAGPLPTALRPKLNSALDTEGIDPEASAVVFDALAGINEDMEKDKRLTPKKLDKIYESEVALDYYSFLDLIGKRNVFWD